MNDDKVGYRNPPKGTRFQPGKSGNPRGRPPNQPGKLERLAREIMDTAMRYREAGRIKSASRRELMIKLTVERALKGNIDAAELLLKMRKEALRCRGKVPQRLIVADWLPDHFGQTGAQKAQQAEAHIAHQIGRVEGGNQS